MKGNNVPAEVGLQANASGNLTPEQERAVGILGKDLCVSAGAGSGKTGVLVERFVSLASEGGLSVSKILCITFTEKAAGEMKQRVAQKFKSLGMEQERQEVEFAYISTIDSFCSRLLRENALEAGLDPDFTILEEYEASSLQRDVAEDLLAQWGETNPEGYKLLLEELYCRDLAESSIELLAKIRSSGLHPKDILVKDDVSPELTETLKGTNLCIKRIEYLLANLSPSSRQREKVEGVVVKLRHLKDVKAEDLQHAHIASLPEIKLTGISSDLKENLKTLREDLLERLRRLYWEGVTIRTKLALREFLSQFLQLYQEEKRKRSVLDFSDLIERAINLLQTFPSLREEQRDKFRHILVDEFQDTNSLQKTLLEMLKGGKAAPDGGDNLFVVGDAQQSIYGFRYADLEVFLEHKRQTQERGGEVIHLNRNFRSRPEIISFVNQVFRGYWGRDDSSTDWRPLVAGSSFAPKGPPSVELFLARGEEGENMEEVRRVEARLLASRIQEIVKNRGLEITRPNPPKAARPITYGDFAILFRSTGGIKLFEAALEEMGIPFFVVSGKGLYDTREIIDLISLLQLIDNPLDEVKLAAVLRSPFAGINDHTLFWMAHYARDKGKEEPLLLQLDRLAGILEIDLTQKERLLRFRGLLERLRGLKERLSIASLMEGILAETQYDSRVLASPNGRQSYANLRKFVELTRDFEKREILGLPQFLRAIRDLRVTETRESEAPTDLEADDVVKIMTVHKAKGLEFPVVAVADMGRDQRSYPSDILFSKKGGLGLKIINPLTNRPEVTATFEEINQEIREKEKGEEERVLYVALTRAQEHLILSGSFTRRSRSEPLERIAETLNISLDTADLPDELTFGEEGYKLRLGVGKGSARIAAPLSVRLSSEEREKILRGEPLPLPAIAGGEARSHARGGFASGEQSHPYDTTPLPIAIPVPRQASQRDYIYSATEIMCYHRCPRLYYFRYKLGLPSMESGELLLTDRAEDELEDSPWARLGTAAHRTLELYRPSSRGVLFATANLPKARQYAPATHHGLEKAVLQALEETLPSAGSGPPIPASQEQMDVLKGWVHNFYSSREGQAVMASKEVRHEMPFLFNYSGTPLRGKIDLLFSPEGKGWCLLDFKSSSNESGMLESYAIQMRLYSLAVRALFGTFPERSVLFFLPRGKAIDVDIGPEAMKGLDEWLKAFFDAEEKTSNGATAFPARREMGCRWCEYGKYCM